MSLLLLFRPRGVVTPPYVEPEIVRGGGGGVWNTTNDRPRQTVDVRKDDEEFMQLMAFVMPIIMEL